MKQVLCYGDSNTWGYDPETSGRYPWGVRWTSLVQEKFSKRRCDQMMGQNQEIRIIEEGLCGRTTVFEDSYRPNRNGKATLPMIMETHDTVDFAVLMLGTNDCKSCYKSNAYKIAMGFEQCLDIMLKTVSPDRILAISPIFLGDDVWKPEYDPEFDQESVLVARHLHEEYEKVAERKGVQLLAASDYAAPSIQDQEHMNPEGHAALAEAIFTVLDHKLAVLASA